MKGEESTQTNHDVGDFESLLDETNDINFERENTGNEVKSHMDETNGINLAICEIAFQKKEREKG